MYLDEYKKQYEEYRKQQDALKEKEKTGDSSEDDKGLPDEAEEKHYLFDEGEEAKSRSKNDVSKSGDIFERHPFFYFFLCVFLLLGIVAFSIVIFNAVAIIDVLSKIDRMF